MHIERLGSIFYLGLIVGLVLFVVGILFKTYFGFAMGTLIICAGLGLILGAFGANAVVSLPMQGITIAGVAALAVVLFWVVLAAMEDKYLKVEVNFEDGQDKKVESIQLVSSEDHLGARMRHKNSFLFVMFGSKIEIPYLQMHVKFYGSDEPLRLACIKREFFVPHMGSGETLSLFYDNKERTLYDVSMKKISGVGGCPMQKTLSNEFADLHKLDIKIKNKFSIFSAALADGGDSSGSGKVYSIGKLMLALQSDYAHERREARLLLAEIGKDAVVPMVERFKQENNGSRNYRQILGILVAFVEMSDNVELRDYISSNFDDEFLVAVIDSVNDKNRYIRLYSSELLSLVHHPKTIKYAFDKFDSASPNGKYNYALLIRNNYLYLPEAEKTVVIEKVKELKNMGTPKTNEILTQIGD